VKSSTDWLYRTMRRYSERQMWDGDLFLLAGRKVVG
jgi:hypothetical protein